MTEPRKKIYWHEAFYEAVKLELADFKAGLHFETEYHLTKEALRMDMLIVKKEKKIEIQKDFGRIFKTYSVLEYKSEHDYISVNDYNKTVAYALLYVTFNKVPEDDITITFVTARYPRSLFRHLKNKGYKITKPYGGIYYVHGDKINCQILHINKLSGEDSLFIRSLRSNLKPDDVKNLLVACKERGELDNRNTFINRVANANAKAFREVLNSSMVTFDMLLREAVENRGWLREFEEKIEQLTSEKQEMEQKVKQEMIHRMIEDGVPLEKAEKWAGYTK